ncbi:MAG: hypothetical protein EXR72_08010 [Myxococcales bacterium]|nr:hypothetical protein [Myxococcales bacterium]
MKPPSGLLLATALLSCSPPGDGEILGAEYGLTVCPKGAVVEGVDVSAYQPNTDWGAVAQSGRGFAIVKATEGTGYVNKYFQQDWAGIKAAGMVRGPYHFFRANVDPIQQADFFLQTVGPLAPGDLPHVLDLETTDGQSGATVAQRALAFLARLQQVSGRTPIVYTSPGFFGGIGSPAGFDKYHLWVAHWQTKCPSVPGAWTDWPLWQYADNGLVPGIAGNVDHDRFNGTMQDLLAFTKAAPAATGLPHLNGNEGIALVNWSQDQHAELFASTPAGDVVHLYTQGKTDTWSMAGILDGGAACGFAASFWGPPWSYAEVWSPRKNGGAGHLWWANNQWNKWQDFGGMGLGLGHFSTAVWQDGRSEVFALGQDGAIWRSGWDLAKKDWTGWQSLGGALVTGAAPIVWDDGHGELFATDGKGAAWHNWTHQAGAWQGWASLGGSLSSRPVPLRWADGHVELFARAEDGHLVHSWWDGKVWAPFAALGGATTILGEPSAIANPKGNGASPGPEVFARDAQGRVLNLWWNGNGFTDFAPLGDQIAASDPFGWIRGDGRGEVFAVDPQGALMRIYRDGNGQWGAWGKLADGIAACAAKATPAVDGGADPAVDGALSDGANPVPGADLAGSGGPDAAGPMEEKGCSCAVGGGVGGQGGWLLLVGLVVAVAGTRRRCRLPALGISGNKIR